MFPLTKPEWQEIITNCDMLPESVNLVRFDLLKKLCTMSLETMKIIDEMNLVK